MSTYYLISLIFAASAIVYFAAGETTIGIVFMSQSAAFIAIGASQTEKDSENIEDKDNSENSDKTGN